MQRKGLGDLEAEGEEKQLAVVMGTERGGDVK